MNWIRSYTPQPKQTQLYRRALIITISGNVLLAAGKAAAAAATGSVALYADAANSISDVLYSILMVLGLWMALRPPDMSHPQGHSRFEPLVGLAVTFSMAFAGFEAARAAFERFSTGAVAVDSGLPTIVLLTAAAMKLAMFFSIRNIARQISSPTLNTTAQDHISDVLTSIAAFIGVMGSRFLPLLDPIAGFLVSLWIFRAAFNAGRENLGFLTGAGAPPELRNRIMQQAESVEGVIKVHLLMTEYVGPKLVVDMHINVDGQMTLNQSHAISDAVIAQIEEMPEIDRVYVHVEPEGWD